MTQDHASVDAVYRIGRPPQAPDKGPKRKGRLLFLMAAALAVMVVSGAGVVLWFVYQEVKAPVTDVVLGVVESPLVTAQKKCAPGSPYAMVGDDGSTLILQSQGKKQSGMSYSQLECFWTELKVTDAVRSEIGATRALDGRRSAEWGSFRASWSYHPDNGVDMTITLR